MSAKKKKLLCTDENRLQLSVYMLIKLSSSENCILFEQEIQCKLKGNVMQKKIVHIERMTLSQ